MTIVPSSSTADTTTPPPPEDEEDVENNALDELDNILVMVLIKRGARKSVSQQLVHI